MKEDGDPAGALANFNIFIRLNASRVNSFYNRGVANEKLKRYEDAVADYDSAIRLNPCYAKAYNNRGIL